MRHKIVGLVKKLAWKISNRDYVLLSPYSYVADSYDGQVLIATRSSVNRRYLPVRYSYHTSRNWQLRYDIRGNACGDLRYALGIPNHDPFCKVELAVQLPFTWLVRLDNQGLFGNDERLPLCGPIPRATPWLVGELEFRTERDEVMYRRTGHRVQCEESESDADYFTGWVYCCYDDEASHYPKEILGAIGHYHTLTGRLLDVGCATGLLVEYALAMGLDAEGIDRSHWAIERANSRTEGRCRVLDLDQARLSDFTSRYDIITLHSVLEHLVNPYRILELSYELCNPGAVVYIQTLNADSLMHRLMGDDWGGYTDHTHKSPWITADWIISSVKQIGFEILSLKRCYVWNDNIYDDVWRIFASRIKTYPASVILEDQFGDIVETILRRPS